MTEVVSGACFSLTRKCASETHSFDEGRTKKIKQVPNSVSGTPKKPMEVPRTLEHKTLGKSLQGDIGLP